MGFFDKFKKKEKYISITLQMNAKLQPIHRADFEDMIENVLKEKNAGEIVGGGSLLMPTGEISCCDIEFSIIENQVDSFISFLNQISLIPKGSKILMNHTEMNIGKSEGLGLYLNGTDLPVEVYQNSDINQLIELLDNALEGIAVRLSHFEGNSETALYYYGPSFETIKENILPITQSYPLCEKCRIVQIA